MIVSVDSKKLIKFNINYQTIKLINNNQMEVVLSSFGAGVKSIKVLDRNKKLQEVTLCPEDETFYFYGTNGKTIGRTAGRILNATFTIDGKKALLEKNNFKKDNLHGGRDNLSKKVFSYQINEFEDYVDVVFYYFSPDGEGGYFGNVDIYVTYRMFNNKDTLMIIFDAKSDCKTLLNLTNHMFFNLSGNPFNSIFNHQLFINAKRYGDLSKRLIVKKVIPVTKEFDFTSPHLIGDYIDSELVNRVTNGYDHQFFLENHRIDDCIASLMSYESGIKMDVYTSYPCVVLYTGGNEKRSFVVDGVDYAKLSSCCLECQFHPDGIHKQKARNGVFDEENPYHEEIIFKFSLS